MKKVFLEILQNSQENTCARSYTKEVPKENSIRQDPKKDPIIEDFKRTLSLKVPIELRICRQINSPRGNLTLRSSY